MREALFYQAEGDKVRCLLCPHQCVLAEGEVGLCRVRRAEGNKLFAVTYGQCVAIALDPVEKKPFYHFYPGKTLLSLGSGGCNFRCAFCQNAELSQDVPPGRELAPRDVVELAKRQGEQCIGLAFTYAEPFVWYEFVLETAREAKKADLKVALVTNGSVNREPLVQMLPFIDAMNIDVKAFTEEFYRSVCKGKLSPVLSTAEEARKHCHVELTYLVIPGLNDGDEEISRLVDWITEKLGVDTPLHFTRYFPAYQMDRPMTPVDTLIRAREIASKKLRYVHLGNVAM